MRKHSLDFEKWIRNAAKLQIKLGLVVTTRDSAGEFRTSHECRELMITLRAIWLHTLFCITRTLPLMQ